MTSKESDAGSDGNNRPLNENLEFVPAFRSGCCAERGPKQYMEDEHICIDNLVDYLDDNRNCPFPGAFYGVSVGILHGWFSLGDAI